ncbi:DNA polymerase III subunit delta' [Rhizobium sp. VS19-DR104.2]|uniref:DNA polymerase III subunit delta' n=1 Tax=unclassified Rhizobium TaxID=2613769 RepID=UPI001CC6625A|nr:MULTISPECIES: DNA polymerase III subunit delta' [unclassified Rhizobium]MBZ5758094.1 DNA polymerase III subunit delta' [Rhizobium sp. VS19-DR96]MBZ5765076.1 DNA polymerase III subunit delta' [Rhizobium sp. VS19-DR129.2]MBZ5772619.1 DNA polymerase III subunit delta' [Rhizobium sp. VS19-DRK62.2]MBZ5782694.1 DNA polymerase III subunit delta' [Rhizobium sp. VS19-DR121]MBZ5800142.1 DNA polymerase III subunit delta' [Rhizobium sp. VS19-DR181]
MSDERPGVLDGAIAPMENTRLFGHAEADAFLAQSYRSGKGHHAILIEGPEGIGKATLAFRFANHVLSHPDPLMAPGEIADPDAASVVSHAIASGASHNLLYLARPVDEKTGKVKSAITVDEVRRAGKFFSQTSGTGNWRIVIIDPADDMNRSAANAILKILEEPPKRALFLVLSHAPGKLLPTIRSRCLPLRLSPLSDEALAAALSNLDIAADANLLRDAKGSVSEALKLINYGGSDIVAAYRQVVASDGPAARKAMHKLADVLSGRESETIFDFFVSQIEDDIMARARQAALEGRVVDAERMSRLHSDVTERLIVSQAYNLDRKQTILTVLGDLKQQL